ncbi:hypothetical protein [Verminephrobacter eiseniae]|uniref:hypothetical protein n=1 Tax=Verminephrobacter eiseniae TaxID=364317 RepID=UPI0022376E83|nr:hypothetical protein [Verminephrobacter eiseniae]
MSNQRVASVRDAIEDTPEEAENMRLRSAWGRLRKRKNRALSRLVVPLLPDATCQTNTKFCMIAAWPIPSPSSFGATPLMTFALFRFRPGAKQVISSTRYRAGRNRTTGSP